MKGNCALVVGASGFIGTRLVRKLANQGVRVRAADIALPREELPGVAYHRLDVREPIAPELGAGADIIYNLAAIHRTPGHAPHEYYDANVHGALNVTALAQAAGVQTIVFTSSIAVYGPCEQLVSETSRLAPTSDYGRSKQMAEVIHRRWLDQDPSRRLIMVRPGVVFGPGEGGNYTHLAKTLRQGVFVYPGRKDTIKSGGYVEELLSTFDFALERPERDILFNFAYPDTSTTEQIVRAFGQVAGFSDRYVTAPTLALMAVAAFCEVANRLGVRNPIHRDRIKKLMVSTRIAPKWLMDRGYAFQTDLKSALELWGAETKGQFV